MLHFDSPQTVELVLQCQEVELPCIKGVEVKAVERKPANQQMHVMLLSRRGL